MVQAESNKQREFPREAEWQVEDASQVNSLLFWSLENNLSKQQWGGKVCNYLPGDSGEYHINKTIRCATTFPGALLCAEQQSRFDTQLQTGLL